MRFPAVTLSLTSVMGVLALNGPRQFLQGVILGLAMIAGLVLGMLAFAGVRYYARRWRWW